MIAINRRATFEYSMILPLACTRSVLETGLNRSDSRPGGDRTARRRNNGLVSIQSREYFGPKVYRSSIPRNVRLAEAPSFGQPIVLYDVLSSGSQAYLALAHEVINRGAGALTTLTAGASK